MAAAPSEPVEISAARSPRLGSRGLLERSESDPWGREKAGETDRRSDGSGVSARLHIPGGREDPEGSWAPAL